MLRILSFNTWNLSGGWRERRRVVVEWLRRLDADIVCLQEVVDDGTRNSARWLAAEAGYQGVAFAGVDVSWAGGLFGPAILSRWPLDFEASYDLPNEPGPTDVQRVLLHARTDGIDVFSTHLTWLYESGRLRELQCVAIDELVAEHADPSAAFPPILAGDFNAEPDSTEIRFLNGLTSLEGRSTYWQDAWRVAGAGVVAGDPGWTWDNRNSFAALQFEPDRRIDYVFVGRRRDGGVGRVEDCRVVCNRPVDGVFPSDHFGVLAEVTR